MRYIMTTFMRNSDAFTWAMESDPRLRSTVVSVMLLDRSPDWDEVRNDSTSICRKVPMLRQRVVPSPPPAPPRWEYAPDFDLDLPHAQSDRARGRHLRQVLEMARVGRDAGLRPGTPALGDDADRRPRKRRRGNGLKFHHALTDGVGGVQIAMILFDFPRSPEARTIAAELPEVTPPPWLQRLPRHSRYDAELVGNAVTGTLKSGHRS